MNNKIEKNTVENKKPLGVDYEIIENFGEEPLSEDIKGYDFNKKFNFLEMIDSFKTTGAQATNLAKAIEIIKEMKENKAYIYFGYTSNMVTTGIREIIRFLVEHKYVNYLVTTCGGIEEDIIKCFMPFKLGNFQASGKELRKKYINRAGNIFIPSSRYIKFEEFVMPLLEKNKDKIKNAHDLINLLGEEIGKTEKGKESIYYWCWKNNIPVYCPAIMDGSLGDMLYIFKLSNPNFSIDVAKDGELFNNSSMAKERTGMIILGAGVVKHSICNANLYRNGADYAVYINTSQEFDGSDSGASPDEAVSWGKIAGEGKNVKVFGDATIIFPLIVASVFAKR